MVNGSHVFLVGMFPVAFAVAGCDVEGGLPPQDAGLGGTTSGGACSGSCGGGGSSGNLDAGLGGSAGDVPDAGPPAAPVNLWADSGFEAGNAGWTSLGNAVVSRVTDVSHAGAASLHVANRTMEWEGAGRDVLGSVTAGTTYEVAAWVRFASASEARLTLMRHCSTDSGIGAFMPLATASAGTEWTLLQGTFEAPTCDLSELTVFIETTLSTLDDEQVDYYVDDVSLMAVP
jgi:hypothetical protein